MTNISAVDSIGTSFQFAVSEEVARDIAWDVHAGLMHDGYTVVQRTKVDKLQNLLDSIYVDTRRPVSTTLEEARKLVRSL